MRLAPSKVVLFSFFYSLAVLSQIDNDMPTLKSIYQWGYVIQLNANNPIEDRYFATELKYKNFNAYFISVLDGHGGDILADYANKRLSQYFSQLVQEFLFFNPFSDEKELIIRSLTQAFAKIEQKFYGKALSSYRTGELRMGTVGSCVTVVVIINKKIYIAQLGDSKARMFSKDNDKFYPTKLTSTHNARKKVEQERLYYEFPNEKNIVMCHDSERNYCYVMGRLQPTRSLGDFHLKFREFNRSPSSFNGPYIKSEPEIEVFDIRENDQYIVMATDGLWDFLSSHEVSEEIQKIIQDKILLLYDSNERISKIEKISQNIFLSMMKVASSGSGIPINDLIKMKPGKKKRQILDDVTIIVVDLKYFWK